MQKAANWFPEARHHVATTVALTVLHLWLGWRHRAQLIATKSFWTPTLSTLGTKVKAGVRARETAW